MFWQWLGLRVGNPIIQTRLRYVIEANATKKTCLLSRRYGSMIAQIITKVFFTVMNFRTTSLLLVLLVAQITFTKAQFFDEIYLQGREFYEVPRSAKTVIDYSTHHTVVGAVKESTTSTEFDISLTQFDDHGDIVWANRYGQSGIDEVGNAAVRGNLNDIIVVGQRNGSEGFITAIDGMSGVLNWTRSVSDIQGTEELLAVAEVATTGEYIAIGTSSYGSSHEVFVVKFNDAGTVFWSRNNQPPFSTGSPNYEIVPTNMEWIPSQQLMLVTGTIIAGSDHKVFAAHLSTATGQFTLFRTFDLTISTPNDATTGGDISMINTQESAMVFTTHRGGIGGPAFVSYMRLNASLMPSTALVYEVYQAGTLLQDYSYSTNCYVLGNTLDVGVTVGTVPADQGIGSLQIDLSTGNIINGETYSSYSDLRGASMVQGLGGEYFFKSGYVSNNDHFQLNRSTIPASPLSANCIENLTGQPFQPMLSYADLNLSIIPHGTTFIQTIFQNSITGLYQNVCPVNGNYGVHSFKKGTTSVNDLAESSLSVYPSLVAEGESVAIEWNGTDKGSTLTISNALGQEIYRTSAASLGSERMVLNAHVLDNGINFISIIDASGARLYDAKVIKM